MDVLKGLVEEKAVVIFSKSSCCVCHSMKQLIGSYGANPTVYELDELPNGQEVEEALREIGNNPIIPAIFIGQEFVGGFNEVLTLQVRGHLVPMLINSGAIWVWKTSSTSSRRQ